MANLLVSVPDDTFELPAPVKGRLGDTFATRRLGLAAAPTSVTTSTRGSAPVPIENFGGYIWGEGGGSIHRSTDGGRTWAVYCPAPVGDTVLRLLPCADGEVIAVRGGAVAKSQGWAGGAPTWATKVTANGTARFQTFQADGDGTKFIVAQYGPGDAGSQQWIDSRYAHISTDGGNTWTQVWDSVTRFGASAANASHLHGVCYDPWGDRFYLAEGHGPGSTIAGVYVSTDDGNTWTRPDGLINVPPPTVLVATDDGIVGGSDHALAGMWGIVRQEDPAREKITRTWAWNVGVDGVIGFGTRGYRDPTTGVVYIGFRTAVPTVAPIIAGGTASAAGVVWSWPTLPVSTADAVTQIVVDDGQLIGAATVSGQQLLLRGDLSAPTGGGVVDTGNALSAEASGTSVALGPGATVGAGGLRTVLIGAAVTSPAATADIVTIGHSASSTGTGSTAIGKSAAATGGSSTAIGSGAAAAGQATAIGAGATTNGATQAIAIGTGSSARTQSVAIGYNATVAITQSQSVAVGAGAAAGSTGATAVGYTASATAFNSAAFGTGATATHTSSIALGGGTATNDVAQLQLGSRHVELTERASAPASPLADRGRLYLVDNGAGKTQLCVRFATGAAQIIATEP